MALNTQYKSDAAAQWLLLFMFLLVLARLVAITLSPFELYADEAQYWRWSQTPDWGYYSKPPLIAWIIGAVTTFFGDSEWAIRLPAPILHGLAALCLYGLGANMRDALTGAMAALCYLMMPAVILSSSVISTDGVLMAFFCFALLQAWQFRQNGKWVSAILLGLAIGFGFLAKYAMLYFSIGILLLLLIDPPTRRAWFSTKGLVIIIISVLVLSPHIWWNINSQFQTISHTVDNANLTGPLFHFDHLLTFILDQLGVFGPISFLFFIGSIIALSIKRDMSRPMIWLLCFSLPVLFIIAFQSFLSRAHANWAATAYPAASVFFALVVNSIDKTRRLWGIIIILTVLALVGLPDLTPITKIVIIVSVATLMISTALGNAWRARGVYWTSIGLHTILASMFAALLVLPGNLTDSIGLSNAVKRVKGWDATTSAIFAKADEIGAKAILTDEREVWHALDYYGRDRPDIALYSWRRYGVPKSFAEQEYLTSDMTGPILIASYRPNFRPMIRTEFTDMHFIGDYQIALGQRSNGCTIQRRFVYYKAEGFNPKQRNDDWANQFEGKTEYPNPDCKTQ